MLCTEPQAASDNFVRSSAKDFSKSHVFINSIAPAYIVYTEMINNV